MQFVQLIPKTGNVIHVFVTTALKEMVLFVEVMEIILDQSE